MGSKTMAQTMTLPGLNIPALLLAILSTSCRLVYRYWRTGDAGDHFYTANPNEVPPSEYNVNIPEGIAFYAYPSAINGAVPVYRYINTSTADHFYTKNPLELDFMPGYSGEGTGWYAY
jgi:uncharacterized protein DUF5648